MSKYERAVRRALADAKRKPENRRKPPRRPGLGDWFAWALSRGYVIPFVKMTPRKWRQLKVACNFADACNCGERKIALNHFGRWIVKPFRQLWKALLPAPPAE